MKRRNAIKALAFAGAAPIYLPLMQGGGGGVVVTPATFGAAIAAGNHAGIVYLLQPGDYDAPNNAAWLSKASGTAAQPVTFRGGPGVRIGPISISGAYQIWEDCEFAYPHWTTRWSTVPGSNPIGTPFYWARLLIYGKGATFKRCTIHDLADVGWGVGASDSLMEDCLTYNIGWESTDRGHGHGWYIQNDTNGPKHMRRCVSVLAYATPAKIYGVNAQLDDIHIEDSVFAIGREGYTYIRSDNGAAHNITIKNLYTYGVQWQHMNALPGGPLSIDGGVIVSDAPWYAYVGAKNWQNGISVRNLQIVSRYPVAYWRDSVPSDWIDQTTYDNVGAAAPFATWAPNAGATYNTLPSWQAGTGNDANSTLSTGLPSAPRIEVIPRAHDNVVIVYNWQGVASVMAPIAGVYRNAMNRAESIALNAGDPLPMDSWTVATPIGAAAPIAAWDNRFGVFLV